MALARDTHVVVAAIVERDGRFLFVEERVEGELKLNQPAGHWDQGESLLHAVCREALEESAWDVEPEALLGTYAFDAPELGYGFLRFAFICKPLRHHPHRALDSGIERAVWLTREELAARRIQHRGPAVLRCVDDYLAGNRYPLELVRQL
ncbi:MAG: NUDIX hydrolase [Pseudomonadota bacterium]